MGTLKSRIKSLHDFSRPNVVKVVTDWQGNALYFSRSPLPNFRDKWNDLKDEKFSSAASCSVTNTSDCTSTAGISCCSMPPMPPTYLETGREAGAAAGAGERLPDQGGGNRIRIDRRRYPDDLVKAQEQYREKSQ